MDLVLDSCQLRYHENRGGADQASIDIRGYAARIVLPPKIHGGRTQLMMTHTHFLQSLAQTKWSMKSSELERREIYSRCLLVSLIGIGWVEMNLHFIRGEESRLSFLFYF